MPPRQFGLSSCGRREAWLCSARMRSARLPPLPGPASAKAASAVFRGAAVAGLRRLAISVARMASIGEFGPSSAEASRATSAATSLMRSRSRAFSTRSEAQDSSVSRLWCASSRARRARSSLACASSACSCERSVSERFGRGAGAAVEFGKAARRSASVLRAVSISRVRWRSSVSFCVRSLRLIGQAVFQIHGAAAEDFGFGGLRDKLLLEFGRRAGRDFRPWCAPRSSSCVAALSSRRSASRRSSTALTSSPASVSRSLSASTWVLQRHDLDLLARRPAIERSSSSPISLASSASLSASARSASCMALVLTANSSSVARNWSRSALSRASSAKMVAVFSPSSILSRLMASPFLPSSASWLVDLGLELLDAHFQAPRRHGEFGAQLVLVGLDFRHRQRGRGFEPPHGQPHRAAVHQGNDDEPDQGRDQEPDPEIHDRFNHETTPPMHLSRVTPRKPCHEGARPASISQD